MCSLLQICVQYCIDVAYVVEIKLNSIQFNILLPDTYYRAVYRCLHFQLQENTVKFNVFKQL